MFTKSFYSQLLGSCHFPAKLLWPTCRTSLPARVCAVKPVHGNDAAIFACFLFCTAPFPRKGAAQERYKNILPLSGRIFNQFSHIYSQKNTRVRFLCGIECVFLQKAGKKRALARTSVRVKAPFAVIVSCGPVGNKLFCKQSVLHQRYFWMVGTRTFILIGFATWSFIPASSAACLSSEKAFAVIAMMGMPAF